MRSDRSEGECKSGNPAAGDGSVDKGHFHADTGNDRANGLESTVGESAAFDRDEQRKIRRLQLMMHMVMSVISQDHSLSVDEAAELIADSKKTALAMFPDKELAYNILYKPRLQRLMRERFRIQ